MLHSSLLYQKKEVVSLGDYIPISCCNMIYKIVARIIARRLKPILSEVILEEQFEFLHIRQIHDVVALAQETLHSVKHSK
jgi:hypothetical protein